MSHRSSSQGNYRWIFPTALAALALAAGAPRPAVAAWPADPAVNVPVCIDSSAQEQPQAASDGSAGLITAWTDKRTDTGDIYVRRVDYGGTPLWTADGVAVCTATGRQKDPALAPDGSGGAIIAWSDGRVSNTNLYVQRVDANGTPLWTANGVAICTATRSQESPVVLADGSGGAFIAWKDDRNLSGVGEMYIQRVNSAGAVQWTANGVQVAPDFTYTNFSNTLVPDGAGGVIVPLRVAYFPSGADAYAQRLSGTGVRQWGTSGALVSSTLTNSFTVVQCVSDGAGGAIFVWEDAREEPTDFSDLYAQRLNGSGAMQWDPAGVAICQVAGTQTPRGIVSDGAGGAIAAWLEARTDPIDLDLYAQRVNAAGVVQWTVDGAPVCALVGTRQGPEFAMAADGAGGAVAAWVDNRGCGVIYGACKLYAQRMNGSGATQWAPDGNLISFAGPADTLSKYHLQMLPNGSGSTLLVWADTRNPGIADIYAQSVNGAGNLAGGGATGVAPGAVSRILLQPGRPNPFLTSVAIDYALPAAGPSSLRVFDVAGRLVRVLASGPATAGAHTVIWDGLDDRGVRAPAGVYFAKLSTGSYGETQRLSRLR